VAAPLSAKMSVRLRRAAAALLLAFGAVAFLQAAYIPAKAMLAQQLIALAWSGRDGGRAGARPWPWADTHPVARLRQSRLGIEQYVLAGASGRTLAFGPAHVSASARPGGGGNTVIIGHRDTHFAWLRDLAVGDTLSLDPARGEPRSYRVDDLRVIHASDTAVVDPLAGDRLRLLTCYPFDQLRPGTPWRYLVTASPMP
jgi:sortase A